MGRILQLKFNPVVEKIGTGNPGRKSLKLLENRELIERNGFMPLHMISITPEILGNWMKENGILEAKNDDDAWDRINSFSLPKGMLREIEEKLLMLPFELRFRIMVRSDESEYGNGSWSSGPVYIAPWDIRDDNDVERIVKLIEWQIKRILTSDFKKSTRIYKQRMGIEETPGVMLMPIYGALTEMRALLPLFSINYLGKINEMARISVGCGIGGANMECSALHGLFERIPLIEFIGDNNVGTCWWTANSNGNIANMHAREIIQWAHDNIPVEREKWERINEMVGGLVSGGAKYLEITNAGLEPVWCVTQIADFEYSKPRPPKNNKKNIHISTNEVLGTKVIKREKIRFKTGKPGREDMEYNENNKGYILILDCNQASDFRKYWNEGYASNADAVILLLNEFTGDIGSHLGGYFRTLGIPVLGIRQDCIYCKNKGCIKFEDLKKELETGDWTGTVYADEFNPKGYKGFLELGKV
ncbi:MAG: hypothetical protein WC309_04910 [Candidatus Paceibacterota bacterium]|jgi:hypothetical protein